jgi:WhiB family redox-sensing transcriptional regulator
VTANGETAIQVQNGPIPLSSEAIDRALYVVGGHPARILALSAFAQTPDQAIAPLEAFKRVRASIDGMDKMKLGTVRKYCASELCTNALISGGYIEEPLANEGSPPTRTFQITNLGMLALAPAGVAAKYERAHPELSLLELLGQARFNADGELGPGPATRLDIVRKLAAHPRGLPTLHLLPDGHVKSAVRALRSADIIQAQDKTNPEERRFHVEPPGQGVANRLLTDTTTGEMRAIILAAARLTAGNQPRDLSGADILEAALTVDASLSPARIWKRLVVQRPSFINVADDAAYGGREYRSNYRLAPQFYAAVTDIVGRVQQIKESRAAWDDAATHARDLLHNRAQTTYLTVKGFRKSRSPESDGDMSVDEVIAAVIEPQGMDHRDLLAAVVQRYTISRKALEDRIARSPSLLVEQRLLSNSSKRFMLWVTNWARTFWPNWREQAACLNNTEAFFPIGAIGLSAAQTEQAKAICTECPVRPACLKTAVEEGDTGIWGGFTEDERRQLPPDVQKALGEVVVHS